jgi:hypothetical protein
MSKISIDTLEVICRTATTTLEGTQPLYETHLGSLHSVTQVGWVLIS